MSRAFEPWILFLRRMMPRMAGLLAVVILPCVRAQEVKSTEPDHPIMQLSDERMEKLKALHQAAPQLFVNASLVAAAGSSKSLLSHLPYTASNRDQGSCGDCWQWSGTGVMEIAHNVQNGVADRLSVQFLNSCQTASSCCEGGWLDDVVTFYSGKGFCIPWSNTSASFASSDGTCGSAPCSGIATSPRYSITSISSQTLSTHNVGQSQAIANIKAVLNQNRAVWFGFLMPTTADWTRFQNFWRNQTETAVFTDFGCGRSRDSGYGGHAVLCVGYDDTVSTNRYWIMVNSWGTANGKRPNGVFRVTMDLDYDCAWADGTPALYFETLSIAFAGTNTAPSISTQPQSRSVLAGGNASFSVAASGTPPLRYQWRKNGSSIAGATNSSLALTNVQSSDAGTFSVVVSNGSGSATSSNATLTVLATLSLADATDASSLTWTTGGSASWMGETTVTHDGADAAVSGGIAHSQSSWLQTTVQGPGNLTFWWKVSSEMSYDLLSFLVDGVQSNAISGEVAWSQKSYDLPPGSHTLRWQYSKDASVNSGSDAGWIDQATFVASAAVAPTITQQPQNIVATIGASVAFSVTASGTEPMAYQWRKDGVNLPGATNTTHAISSVQLKNAGTYSVVVTNAHGSATSSGAVLSIATVAGSVFDDFDPGIDLSQWSDFGGSVGSTILATNYGGSASGSCALWFGNDGARYATTIPVNTSGGGTVSFQIRIGSGSGWPWEAADLPDEGIVCEASVNGGTSWMVLGTYDTVDYCFWTQVQISIPAAACSSSTLFRWRQLSNSGDSFDHWTLDDVRITGGISPSITQQPQSIRVQPGLAATFSVTATGSSPMFCQWRKNGVNLAGATNTTHAISSVHAPDAGIYSVVVTNAYGTAVSSNASLTLSAVSGIVYLRSTVSIPWGRTDNEGALDRVFGSGNWRDLRYETVNVPSLLTSESTLIFMEGGDENTSEMNLFVATNLTALQNWVADGGTLFINSAPNEGVSVDFGFGVTATYPDRTTAAVAVAPGHAIFNGPFLPVGTNWSGDFFGHTTLSGPALVPLVVESTNRRVVLAEMGHGKGRAILGGMSLPSFHLPSMESSNLLANILSYAASISPSNTLPAIVSQPQNVTVAVGSPVSFSVSATGSAPLRYQWRKNGTSLSGATNASYSIASVTTGDAGSYSAVVANGAGSVTSSNATLSVLSAPTLADALDARGLSWTSGGSALWTGQASVTHDGVDAACSGSIANQLESWVQTTVTGPGQLSFWWKVSSESGYDFLVLLADGVRVDAISGETAWAQKIYKVGNGSHTLRWTYMKDASVSAGSDTAWLDQVSFLSNTVPTILTQPQDIIALTGATTNFSVTVTGATPIVYSWRKNGVAMASATNPVCTLSRLTTNNAGYYSVVAGNAYGAVTSQVARLIVKGPPMVAVTNIAAGQRLSNTVFTVRGRAADSMGISNVWLSLNNGPWTLASGTTNWSSVQALDARTNTLAVYAEDIGLNHSVTNRVTFVCIRTAVMQMQIAGQGTVTPNYGGRLLELGANYTMRAAATNKHTFLRWETTTNGGASWTTSTNALLSFVMQSNLLARVTFLDTNRPAVTITNLAAGQRLSNGVFTVRGRATDNAAVSNVWISLNSDPWIPATGAATWSAPVSWNPGTNLVSACCSDATGNYSPTTSVKVVYVVSGYVTILTNGTGTLSTNYNGRLLELGRSYAMTARAGTGSLFKNWTLQGGGVLSTQATLNFVMRSNLVISANFTTNIFYVNRGVYNGLFIPTNNPGASNSGFITLTLADSGSFTGRVLLGGASWTVSSKFDATGYAAFNVPRTGQNPLMLHLTLNETESAIDGDIGDGTWEAPVSTDRALTNGVTPMRCTLVVEGGTNAWQSPPGEGTASVVVDVAGGVTLSGNLADGTAISQKSAISADGIWPMYVSLYGGNGVFMGWMPVDGNGTALWIKPQTPTNVFYPEGFHEEPAVAVSRYVAWTNQASLVDWTNGIVAVGGGNLPDVLTSAVVWSNSQVKVLSGGSISNLTLTVTRSSGLFTGSFTHPVTRKKVTVRGALLQQESGHDPLMSGGWFTGTNQAGFLWMGSTNAAP
jgi:C1A family cysteine protease